MNTARWQRFTVLGFWLLTLALLWGYAQSRGLGPRELLADTLSQVTSSAWGPLLLVACYLVRPLLLLPVTLLTVASGFLFGPLWGFVYALAAMLGSSALAYGLAYMMGSSSPLKPGSSAARYLTALKTNPFETVLIGRFLFMPGDLINYGAGYLRMNLGAFLLASAIGGLPGLLMAVLAGASVEGALSAASLKIDATYLGLSAALLVLSLTGAYLLRKRKRVGVYKVVPE